MLELQSCRGQKEQRYRVVQFRKDKHSVCFCPNNAKTQMATCSTSTPSLKKDDGGFLGIQINLLLPLCDRLKE